jgi:hypothetical protein
MAASKDHVVSGLIEKRRQLAGNIDELQRQLDQHRADLTHIDGTLRVLARISIRRLSARSAPIGAIGTSLGMSCHGSALACLEPQPGNC